MLLSNYIQYAVYNPNIYEQFLRKYLANRHDRCVLVGRKLPNRKKGLTRSDYYPEHKKRMDWINDFLIDEFSKAGYSIPQDFPINLVRRCIAQECRTVHSVLISEMLTNSKGEKDISYPASTIFGTAAIGINILTTEQDIDIPQSGNVATVSVEEFVKDRGDLPSMGSAIKPDDYKMEVYSF